MIVSTPTLPLGLRDGLTGHVSALVILTDTHMKSPTGVTNVPESGEAAYTQRLHPWTRRISMRSKQSLGLEMRVGKLAAFRMQIFFKHNKPGCLLLGRYHNGSKEQTLEQC